jgi:capsular exopolysaccharide synthesis family protein
MSELELAMRKARAAWGTGEERATARLPESHVPHAAFAPAWEFAEANQRVATGAALETPVPPVPPGSIAVPAAVGDHLMDPQPAVARMPLFHGFNEAYRDKLAIGEGSSPEIREQFRRVAAALYRVREQRPIKVVMVVSAVPGEGKTMTAVNLALTLSESYKSRVLLIDADLRRPSIHRVFNLPNTAGLKERLVAAVDDLQPIPVTPHLSVLTAGAAAVDPMSAIVSDRMRAVLAADAALVDWVVLDTPPVELLPDANLLASLADVAILVVHAGSTKCELSQRAVAAIGRDRIVGVVLNQVRERERTNYYEYYGDRKQD